MKRSDAMAGLERLSLEALAEQLRTGKRHPGEIIEGCRKRIEKIEPTLHALNRATIERAQEGLDGWASDTDKPFSGIPYIQKDNICTRGVATDCSSRILEGFVPPYSATAEIRVAAEGLRLVGKSNLDEFSMGSSTEYSAWGPTRNPFDVSRVSGGSSGGSAAAVAAGYVPLAFGSDTGGSVRQPAAFCGVVGLRPTYGRVSRWGLVAFASSLDQIGPITTTVRDAAVALSIIQGPDNRDSTLVAQPKEDYLAGIEDGIGELRIGVLDVGFADWVDARVKSVFEDNVRWFRSRAKSVQEAHLKSFDLLLAAYYILAPSEASSNLARFDGIRYGPSVGIASQGETSDEGKATGLLDYYRKNRGRGFGEEVTRRIMIGTFALSSGYYEAYYLRAQKVRTRLRAELDELWREVDVIISPTTPSPPFKLGACMTDPLDMYRADMFVLPQPMAGCPAISLNGGWTESDDNGNPLRKSKAKDCLGKATTRLPIGLQMTAPPFAESVLFRAARAFERENNG